MQAPASARVPAHLLLLDGVMSTGPASTLMLLHKRGAPSFLLPEILKEVYLSQRNGLLHVTHGEAQGVTFRSVNGEIVSGSSTAEKGRLGETMVRRGVISKADLEKALKVVTRQKRRLAPVLREMNLVDTAGLEEALAFHIRLMLFSALRWQECSVLFEDQELPDAPAEDLTLQCGTAELILELTRRIPDQDAVREALGDLGRPLVAAGQQPSSQLDGRMGPLEKELLARADGRTAARSIIEAARLPVDELERSLLGLLCTGLLQFPPPKLRVVL